MTSEKEQKEIIYKICSDIINNKISTMEDIRKVWPRQAFEIKFYNDLFNDVVDSFEHLPSRKGDDDKTSFEFLNIYTAWQILKYDKDVKLLEKAYKTTLAIKGLTKNKVDENLKNCLW